MSAEHWKRWPCHVCGHPIKLDPDARLGEPRYAHVSPVDNLHGMAVRGPDETRDIQAEILALRVCRHEDCPYETPEGADECENHEPWMT